MKVVLTWITPSAEEMIVHMARVSNPLSQEAGAAPDRLIRYLIRNKHWSPFEMASACFEIETTRDIARQILRHRSFSFQEFSQRYAAADELPMAERRECRMQDRKNRQNSFEASEQDMDAANWWVLAQEALRVRAAEFYSEALNRGIAKEVARAVLPEGLTASRMYMAGTLRSWVHYVELRTTDGTQKEHREIAKAIEARLSQELPTIMNARSQCLTITVPYQPRGCAETE